MDRFDLALESETNAVKRRRIEQEVENFRIQTLNNSRKFRERGLHQNIKRARGNESEHHSRIGRSIDERELQSVDQCTDENFESLGSDRGSDAEWEKLKNAIRTGNHLAIGRIIREGIKNGKLTDVQLKELALHSRVPVVSFTQSVFEVENCTLDELRSLRVADQFLKRIPTGAVESQRELKVAVHSLTTEIQKQNEMELKQKGTLDALHKIEASAHSEAVNLNVLYEKIEPIGQTAKSQLISVYAQMFKKFVKPVIKLWGYTHRPCSNRPHDKDFIELPPTWADALEDFGVDIIGCYLPPRLLIGEIDSFDPFVKGLLADDQIEEVLRRRRNRQHAILIVNLAIGNALRNLRLQHYDIREKLIVPCALRKECDRHVRWDQLKVIRDQQRKGGDLDTSNKGWDAQVRLASRQHSLTTD